MNAEDDAQDYCRQLEAYLCRKNDGHLIRIVGPAFEQVSGWALKGVPIRVAERGIDRYFERYYAKGPRRRPVRIEFCEADVLDVFDEWRRAVGVPGRDAATFEGSEDEGSSARTNGPLAAHLDRVIARLTALRGGGERTLEDVFERLVRELDAARAGARKLRGHARTAFLERLSALDTELVSAARAACGAAELQQLAEDADAELAPFRERMPQDAYEASRQAAADRLIRERRRLPVIRYE